MNADEYTVSAKAKTDCKVLKLSYYKLLLLREQFERLGEAMTLYETYCDENGIPYCDYKLHRTKQVTWSAHEKFKHGVMRVIRIIKSYKSSALSDLLQKVKEEVQIGEGKKQSKRKQMLLKVTPLTTEQRNEQSLIVLTQKIEDLNDIINVQKKDMKKLKDEIISKLNRMDPNYKPSSENDKTDGISHLSSNNKNLAKKANDMPKGKPSSSLGKNEAISKSKNQNPKEVKKNDTHKDNNKSR